MSEEQTLIRTLHRALLTNRRILTNASVKEWKKDFKILLKDVEFNKIERVLNWYVVHLKDKYVPVVHSAKGFREKFDAILAAMRRPENQTVKPIEEWLSEWLDQEGYEWPFGAKEKEVEPRFAQLTFDNFTEYQHRASAWVEQAEACAVKVSDLGHSPNGNKLTRYDPKVWTPIKTFRALLAEDHGPREFTRLWIEETHHIAWRWEGWKGNLLSWVFHLGSKRYDREQQKRVEAYCGDSITWDALKGLIGENPIS